MAPTTHALSYDAILTALLLILPIVASDRTEAELLLRFRASLKNATRLSGWGGTGGASPAPCEADAEVSSWEGVLCDRGKVWGLKLEHMGLSGSIDVGALSELDGLRTVSLMGNGFQGPAPDFSGIGWLKSVYLSRNGFSGEIPGRAFAGMAWLKKLHLAENRFSGKIPAEFASLPRLINLRLEENEFEGTLPDFPPDRLKDFNVSNNKLSGKLPQGLRHFSASSFSGNKDLCGGPLNSCPDHNSPARSKSTIVIVLILTAAAVAALAAAIIVLLRRNNSPQPDRATAEGRSAAGQAVQRKPNTAGDVQRGASSASSTESNKESVKLTFLRDDGHQFVMADLLKASAVVLGGGMFGSTYRTALSKDRVMVVKRFKHMDSVSREEFGEHMQRLGRLSHENVLPVVAYCYRRKEKLLVFEYVQNFSLAVQLHGSRSQGRQPPDWPARLRILKGIARGLQYLYVALPGLTAPHGHLKSSNVVLDSELRPLLTDYGLVPVVNQEHAPEHMISYKSPEYKSSRRINKKTDVWSFGVLLLETLTGRFPSNLIGGSGGDGDVAMWVESVLRGGGGEGEVLFDKDMEGATERCRGEMMKLLELGLECCRLDPEQRPDMAEVVERIERIKERSEGGGAGGEEYQEYYSSYASELDAPSTATGLSDDLKVVDV